MKFENVFKSNCGVYRILNIKTNEFYIGSSKNVVTRFRQHVTSMRGNYSHCSTLQKVFNKYGEESLIFQVLLTCNEKYIRYYEQSLIYELNPRYNRCYNITSKGLEWSKESRNKLSNSKKNTTLSEEHKRKISESMKGKTVSFETKQKMSKSRTGIKLSEKTKQKMRNAHKGKKLSENTKLKMSIAHKIKT